MSEIDFDEISKNYKIFCDRQERTRTKEIEKIIDKYPDYETDTKNVDFYEKEREEIANFLLEKYYPESYCL